LSQAQLAARVRTSQQAIARIEAGQRKVGAVELVVIARALDLDVADLLRRIEKATPLTKASEPRKTIWLPWVRHGQAVAHPRSASRQTGGLRSG
jgi:transcriptional regulator with XRE-family HTH domain